MATSLTKTPQECTDPPDSADALQRFEDELENKTRQHLIDDCKALHNCNVCLQGIVQELQEEELAKKNEKLEAENRELTEKVDELTRKLKEREQSYLAERLKEEAEKIKKLEGESCDRKKDADAFKQELEECKKQVQQAQETMFQPILGILQRQQELLRRENQYEKAPGMRADEHPYEEIHLKPEDTVTTSQKEPSHPKFNNTVHGKHVTINHHFTQVNTLPSAHSLAKGNPSKPPPHDNFPTAHTPADDQSIKTPVQSTDSQAKETESVSSESAVMHMV